MFQPVSRCRAVFPTGWVKPAPKSKVKRDVSCALTEPIKSKPKQDVKTRLFIVCSSERLDTVGWCRVSSGVTNPPVASHTYVQLEAGVTGEPMRDFHVAVLSALLLVSPALAAKRDKNHNDAFVNGPPDEAKIAKEVRHQLVTLPYYGVFDDLAFRVDGSTVTLLGAVTRPVLK